jgi:hypothetical protein
VQHNEFTCTDVESVIEFLICFNFERFDQERGPMAKTEQKELLHRSETVREYLRVLQKKLSQIRQNLIKYGFLRTVSRLVNVNLYPMMEIGVFYKVNVDLLQIDEQILKLVLPKNVSCLNLSFEEIKKKKHYFNEKKLSYIKDRMSKGAEMFCIFNTTTSEILGFDLWTDSDCYVPEMDVTVSCRNGSVYSEYSINPVYRRKNYGLLLQSQISLWLRNHGYTSFWGFISSDNFPSLAIVTKKFGGKIERKYFRFRVNNFNYVVPLTPNKGEDAYDRQASW